MGNGTFVDGYICVMIGFGMTLAESIINIIIFGINIFFIIKLLISIKKTINKHQNEFLNSNGLYKLYFWRIIKYLLFQLIIFGPITVLRFLYCVTLEQFFLSPNSFFWTLFRESIFSLAGFIYSIIYGFNGQIVEETKKLLCCSSKIEGNIEEEDISKDENSLLDKSGESDKGNSTSEETYHEIFL